MSYFKIPVEPPISQSLIFCCFSYLLGQEKTHSKKKFYKKDIFRKFWVKVMILDFQPQNGTQSHIFDETLL